MENDLKTQIKTLYQTFNISEISKKINLSRAKTRKLFDEFNIPVITATTSTRKMVPCIICGKLVSRKPSELEYSSYTVCGQKCNKIAKIEKSKHKRVRHTVPCVICGKTKEIRTYQLIYNQHFCSRECRTIFDQRKSGENSPCWKGGHYSTRGPSWRKQRRAARIRDKDICQRCGQSKEELGKNLDVHHIIPFREFGIEKHLEANDLKNLICYCKSCHLFVEHNPENTFAYPFQI